MYKGLLLGLSGIWLVALLLSFAGSLSFSPIALVASSVVLIASTALASLLCGWLFGVKSQLDSSFITGLILVFIFTPTADASLLIMLAFVGLVAGVSKYVVTFRGRHIFNPAAFAAVVIGLTGLGAASWWVATPALTPIVFLVGLIAVYQSKRYVVPGIFLAITIPVLLIQFLAYGATFEQSLWLLMSWPILFLAGIMLTEPLTLPPRKWQMCIVAAVVAVAFLIPLKVGSFQMTPALALLIGNLVAAIFAARQAITLVLKKRTALTPTTDEFIFETSVPLHYEPGQYMEVMLPHKRMDFRGARRRFSLTAVPGTKQASFGIKFYEPSSSFKRTLKALGEGASMRAVNVEGDFVLPRDTTRPLLFIAGGIGITPFISHLRSLQSDSKSRDIELIYAVSSPEEIAYKDVLVKSGIRVLIVSPKKPEQLPKHWSFSKSTRIDYDAFETLVPDTAERWAYISGPTPFVQYGKSRLRKLGVKSVKTDYFAGY